MFVVSALTAAVFTFPPSFETLDPASPPPPPPPTPLTPDELRAEVTKHRTTVLALKHGNFSDMLAASAEMLQYVNQAVEVADTSALTTEIPAECPPEPPFARKKNGCVHCSKYRNYIKNCNTTGTLFMDVRLPSFIHVMDSIAKWAELKPGLRILDWGAGCGTKLNYWKIMYGVHGVGLDYTTETVHYARGHAQPGVGFCWADGSTVLKFLPSNTYDRVVSHSSLYHVMPVARQCKVLRQAVRITKPGGIIWFGHFRSGPALKFWRKGADKACPLPVEWNCTVRTLRDTTVFGAKESWYASIKAISILVHKGTNATNATSEGADR